MYFSKLISVTFFSLVLLLAFSGCKKPPQPKSPESIVQEELKQDKPLQNGKKTKLPRKYSIKSGIIHSTIQNSFMKVELKSTTYFDKYGELETVEETSEIEMMGQKVKTHQLRITRDGFIHTIDMIKKTGAKAPIVSFEDLNSFDFSKFNKETLSKWNIEELPDETYLGKKCKVTTFNNKTMKGKVLVWQGITLYSEIDVSGMNIKSVANKIETNININKSIFEIPKDIKFY